MMCSETLTDPDKLVNDNDCAQFRPRCLVLPFYVYMFICITASFAVLRVQCGYEVYFSTEKDVHCKSPEWFSIIMYYMYCIYGTICSEEIVEYSYVWHRHLGLHHRIHMPCLVIARVTWTQLFVHWCMASFNTASPAAAVPSSMFQCWIFAVQSTHYAPTSPTFLDDVAWVTAACWHFVTILTCICCTRMADWSWRWWTVICCLGKTMCLMMLWLKWSTIDLEHDQTRKGE